MTRAGAQALTMLASPLTSRLLLALANGPRQQMQLRRETGSPAQTTLRAQLRRLTTAGLISRRRRTGFPGGVDHELTEAGRDLLSVVAPLRDWLADAPERPLPLGSPAAKAAIKALAEAWSTCMLRALAAKPASLTELDRLIESFNYPSLERRLAAMKLAGQAEPLADSGERGAPCRLTDWARRAVGPLIAAARWERRHLGPEAPPLGGVDIETAFLLAMPLLRLPDGLCGSCRLAADVGNGRRPSLAGVVVEARQGRIESCTTRLDGYPDAWALGDLGDWMTATIEGDAARLEVGGDSRLALAIAAGIHHALFKPASVSDS